MYHKVEAGGKCGMKNADPVQRVDGITWVEKALVREYQRVGDSPTLGRLERRMFEQRGEFLCLNGRTEEEPLQLVAAEL